MYLVSKMFPRLLCLASGVYGNRKIKHVVDLSKILNKMYRMQPKILNIHGTFYSSDSHHKFYSAEISNLDSDLQQRFKEIQEKTGFIPNVFKALAYRPKELRAFLHYYDVIMDKEYGNLTPAEKEMIIVATSGENKCLYCVVAHSAIYRIHSKDPYVADQVATNWKVANITAREKAILEFAMEIMNCNPITDEHYEALAAQGLNKDDAWDIGAVVSMFAMSNRMAYTVGIKPNPEFYLLGRVPKAK